VFCKFVGEKTQSLSDKQFEAMWITGKDTSYVHRNETHNFIPYTKFLLAGAAGLHGFVFSDFGEEHKVWDWTGNEPDIDIVEKIFVVGDKGEEKLVVSLDSDVPHLEVGSTCTLSDAVFGERELQPTTYKVESVNGNVVTLHENQDSWLEIGMLAHRAHHYGTGQLVQNPPEKKISYNAFADVIAEPVDMETSPPIGESFTVPADMRKGENSQTDLQVLMRSLFIFKAQQSRLPFPGSEADAEVFLEVAMSEAGYTGPSELAKRYARTCRGNVSSIASIVGGVVAQEALKAVGKYTPIRQWFHWDQLEMLPIDLPSESDCAPTGSRYDGQIAIFGKQFQNEIQGKHIHMVGAGAIGCEIAKHLALMGVCTDGELVISDMDTVGFSNLNRQFMFKFTDVNDFKSETLCRRVKQINKTLIPKAVVHAICERSEETLWEDLDIVISAVDTIEARQYLDYVCGLHKLPLLDSATTGVMGTTQVVIPGVTERLQDGPALAEKPGTPLCTLKNFPRFSKHCLEWSIHEASPGSFVTVFDHSVRELQAYLTAPEAYMASLSSKYPMDVVRRAVLKQLQLDLKSCATGIKIATNCIGCEIYEDPKTKLYRECVAWARRLFQRLFHDDINQLLHSMREKYGPQVLTEHGLPFWTGHRARPHPLTWSREDSQHVQFIFIAANLRAAVLGCNSYIITDEQAFEEFLDLAEQQEPLESEPVDGVFFNEEDADDITSATGDEEYPGDVDKEQIEEKALIAEITKTAKPVLAGVAEDKLCVYTLTFSDLDINSHVDYCTAVANLRARNYQLDQMTRTTVKTQLRGIVPAVACTTACMAGLSAGNLYQLAKGGLKAEEYLNVSWNLGTNSICAFGCVPAQASDKATSRPAITRSLQKDSLYTGQPRKVVLV